MVIHRTLTDGAVERLRHDFGDLIHQVQLGRRGLELCIRPDDSLNLYHRGNSLARITVLRNSYRVEIAVAFGLDPERKLIFQGEPRQARGRLTYRLAASHEAVHAFFKQANLDAACARVRAVDFSVELALEQMILLDNRGRQEYIILDRQVQDTASQGRKADLLALRQLADAHYALDVIEVKLADSPQAAGVVIEQVCGYRNHLARHFEDYKACYERHYAQKRALGLLGDNLPPAVVIERPVRGRIVVTGFAGATRNVVAKIREQLAQRVLVDVDVLGPLCELPVHTP